MAQTTNALSLSGEPGEVPFGLDEIFYSRTDQRGVIRMGNAVFRRVSGYDWSDLVGAPHKIVRHPDMPKAVFRILWRRILAGDPVGAYVKNRARDGRHYWVYAAIMPMPDGFFSIRIKPSGPVFGTVKAVYAAIRAREIDEKLDPEDSAALLLDALQQAGFSDYLDFMSQTLTQELAARNAANGPRKDRLEDLQIIGQNLAAAASEQQALVSTFNSLQMVPNNIRIVAAQMEKSGGPITAISENYRIASGDILLRLGTFARADGNLCTRMAQVVSEGAFLLGFAELQSELVRQFRGETATGRSDDAAQEMSLLTRFEADCTARARDGLAEAVRVAGSLADMGRELRRVVLGLDMIKIMGQVECARHGETAGGLAATIEALDQHHADVRSHIEAFVRHSDTIRKVAARCAA